MTEHTDYTERKPTARNAAAHTLADLMREDGFQVDEVKRDPKGRHYYIVWHSTVPRLGYKASGRVLVFGESYFTCLWQGMDGDPVDFLALGGRAVYETELETATFLSLVFRQRDFVNALLIPQRESKRRKASAKQDGESAGEKPQDSGGSDDQGGSAGARSYDAGFTEWQSGGDG